MLAHKTMSIRGKAISCRDSDPENQDKTCLVFVHGHSQSLESFQYQFSDKRLQEQFRLIALDLPGHGHSARLSDYSLEVLSMYFSSFVEELNIKDVILMGHSLGAHVIAQSLSTLNPKGIVTWGYAPFTKRTMKISPYRTDNPVLSLFSKGKLKPSELLNLYNSTHFLQNKETSGIFMKSHHRVDENFRPLFSASIDKGLFQDELTLLKNSSATKLEFYSKNDFIINVKYLNTIGQDVFTNIEELPHSGHFPQTETFKLFNQKVFNFTTTLNRQDSVEKVHGNNNLREVISAQVAL